MWVALQDDGTFAWSYEDATSLRRQGDTGRNAWSLIGDRLTLSWNGGFSTDTFAVTSVHDAVLQGTKSNAPEATLRMQRVRP
jgi:hypothetical protein